MERSEIDPDVFNAFEAEGWERQAGGYGRFLGRVTAQCVEPLLDAASVGAGSRVLDVATGPGYVAGRAAARGAEVVGVDVAAAMVALAQEAHPAVEFRQADAHALPFDDGSFDAVLGNFVILHLGRPEQAVREFARVLRSEGKLALTSWDRPEHARFLGVFLEAVAEAGLAPPEDVPAGPDFFRFAAEGELDATFADAGLGEREVKHLAFTQAVSSPDELWDGLLAGTVRTEALLRGQSEEARGRTRAAFDRRIAEYRHGDRFELPVSVKLGVGRKVTTAEGI